MARLFSSTDAKRITNEYREIMSKLDSAVSSTKTHRAEIKESSDNVVNQAALIVLKEISVEELNREKRGFHIKTLREHGYTSVADVVSASTSSIASVNGISEDGAQSIKCVANNIFATARKSTKIQISEDNKTPEITKLVATIHNYRVAMPHINECKKILDENSNQIESMLTDLHTATGGIRWTFSSTQKKEMATQAYSFLMSLKEQGFLNNIKTVLDHIEQARHCPDSDAWGDFSENSVRFFNILEEINPGLIGSDDVVYGLPEELAREIQAETFFPDGLLCDLRRYQEWGVKYVLHQKRVLLGDEMGLGKTIQAIAVMVSLRNAGATHFVVVCPASVITNWCREIRKMSNLSICKIHGADRTEALKSWEMTGGVAVTTYETTSFFRLNKDFSFSMLVVDEAHYIKNKEAQRTVNVKNLASYTKRLLFMTGTALENDVDEMIALIQILQPQIASNVQGMVALASAPVFRERVAPVYYRRKREDVLTELPELIEVKEWCTLLPEEEQIYENAVLSKKYADARKVSWNADDLHNSSKAIRLMEIIEEAENDGRKVLVFSFFLDTIQKIKTLLGNKCLDSITGAVEPQHRQEIIDEFDAAPKGTVLVAQIQSGGTGLNIQSASVVIICEPQFKPSIENQAISRAYRMGQTRNVLVYRLLCDDTVDEKITALLKTKQDIFDAFADKSVVATESKELDEQTFSNIINEEINRINIKRGCTANS